MHEQYNRFPNSETELVEFLKELRNDGKRNEKFLDKFPEEQDIVVIAVRPQEQKKYEVTGLVMLTELAYPVIGVELGAVHEFDEKEQEAAEECEKV